MKLKFTILFTALIAVAAVGCKQKETTAEDTAKISTGAKIPDSVLVDVRTAKEYVNNYAPHAGYVEPTEEEERARKPKKPDTRCVWFSKQRLKEMLTQLEKEDGDGVRFYMITYNKKYDTTLVGRKTMIPPKKYWGYNTLLMVSTKPVKTGDEILHFDYYDNVLNQEGAVQKNTKQEKPGFIVTFTPENRGELCPPPADCFLIGATLLDPLQKTDISKK